MGSYETGCCWSCDLNNMSIMSLASACVRLTSTAVTALLYYYKHFVMMASDVVDTVIAQ